MSSNSQIVDWFVGLGISDVLTTDDILSGNTIHSILKKTLTGYKNDFVTPASAVNKIANWNNIIKNLEKMKIKVSADDKNKIFHGDEKIVYNLLSQVKSYADQNTKQPQVDINKIDHRSDPRNSKSLLQLFILVIIKNLGLNAKQSVALLSNDSKYLAHILAKGFKDQSGPVINLLRDFQSLLPRIHQFCINKENEVFFLKSIKPGLISKFKEISKLSLQILQQFSLETQNPFEILRVHLMPTLALQFRRHGVFLNRISVTIIKLSKYTKPLLSILTSNLNPKELLQFCYQILCISEENNELKSFYSLLKINEIVTLSIDSLSDSLTFTTALLLLIKMIDTNIEIVANDPRNINNMLNNLQHLSISKSEQSIAYINGLFTLLDIFGSQKNPIAPQVFKLCIDKYKQTINYDDSILYAYNFLYVIEQFPSIPNSLIANAVVERYENFKEVITDLDIQLLTRIALGFNKDSQEQDDDRIKIPDEKTALKIYNVLSKVFFEEISNSSIVADAIVFIFVSHPNSQLINDLNIKMVKVALAVHYANIRKLNMSKSIVNGVVKVDVSNAFIKRKNADVQYLLKQFIILQNEQLNRAVQPLICYSYIQSDSKNKTESEGLGSVLSFLGNPSILIKKYQQQVKILHDQKKTKKKHTTAPTPRQQEENNLPIASTDQFKINKIPTGQNYSIYLSRIQKVTMDAKNGLLKAQRGFQDKKKKVQLQEMKKQEDEQKKQQLQRKFTLKVLEKGVRLDPRVDTLHQYLYEFNFKQNQLQKDQFYDLTSIHLFNPAEQQDNDLDALKYLMKKHNKVLKVFYANYGGKLRPNSISLFDELAEKQSLMQVANVWKLFKDYELDEFMTIREAQYLVQKINTQKKKSYYDMNLLDFQAFQDFIIQASMTMFTRPPKDLSGHRISEMVEETFYQFKMLAGQNKVDIRMFDDESTTFEQDQTVGTLNVQLRKNQDYILPEGYKKVVQKKIQHFHSVSLDAFDSSYTDVLNILDEVIFEEIGFHIIEPFSEVTTSVYAKSLLSKKKEENNDDFKEKYFSVNVKKELFKYSGWDRVISRQVAFCLSEVVDAVEKGKTINKNKYSTKQLEDEKRKMDEEMKKKREKRDQELKKILEKHKSEKDQKQQKGNEEKKLKEEKKSEEQKKKKQRYQQEMKKKVEQFQQKKQQTLKKQEQERQKQKKRQQQLFEKKRQQLSKAAQEIQEKKAAQQEEKKQQEMLLSKSKKSVKIRSSPAPVKKNTQQMKSPANEKNKEKENKDSGSISKSQQKN